MTGFFLMISIFPSLMMASLIDLSKASGAYFGSSGFWDHQVCGSWTNSFLLG